MSHPNPQHDPSNCYPEDGFVMTKEGNRIANFHKRQFGLIDDMIRSSFTKSQKEYEEENPDPDYDLMMKDMADEQDQNFIENVTEDDLC